ncbi:hypothetical protein AB0L97_14840 [Nocardia sp. NPDC051911]|uniref:hypothetical protein n=1 Tax=Nocardia sp. NPDC051911 TaxID=3154648 RepID=UPI0034282FE4
MDHHTHGRTRRVLARAAAASALALMPVAAVAVPALADPIVLEQADQLDATHGRHGHDDWNRGRHNDWDRGRNDDWFRGRNRHDDWDHGRPGWDHGWRPPTGSGF